MNWAGEVCSARGTSKTPSSCGRNLTVQVGSGTSSPPAGTKSSGGPRTTSRMRNGVLVTTPRVGNFGVHARTMPRKLFGPSVGLAWDPFGNGKTAVRAGFGTYYSLIDDLSFLLNSLPPYNGSLTDLGLVVFHHAGDSRRGGSAVVRSRVFPRPAPPMRRRECRPTRRRRRCRNGTSPSSSNSTATRLCASPMSDRSDITGC